MEKPQIYKREDMLPVSKIRKMIPGKEGGPCSRQHIYNLIEKGELSPAFRFGTHRCVFVPRPVVELFLQRSMINPAA